MLEAATAIRATGAVDALGRPGIFDWRPLEIESLIAIGRLSEAERLLAEFELSIPEGGLQSAAVALARLRGSLAAGQGHEERAAEQFEAAWEQSVGLEQPLGLALLALADGQRLRGRGQRRAAIAHLRSARDQLADLGAQPYLERCDHELELAGVPNAGSGAETDRGLTPAELAVARLVATGKTNREVAEELYVTVKTVEFHLRGVFAKLGITSRHEIAAQLGAGADIPEPLPATGEL